MSDFKQKYLKYKNKYLELQAQLSQRGGIGPVQWTKILKTIKTELPNIELNLENNIIQFEKEQEIFTISFKNFPDKEPQIWIGCLRYYLTLPNDIKSLFMHADFGQFILNISNKKIIQKTNPIILAEGIAKFGGEERYQIIHSIDTIQSFKYLNEILPFTEVGTAEDQLYKLKRDNEKLSCAKTT